MTRQTPHKGDAHTSDALRVAHYLTHPVSHARFQLRFFRCLPPEPERFAKLYPELVEPGDPWVKYYHEVMDSENTYVADPMTRKSTPDVEKRVRLSEELVQWMQKEGCDYLQGVFYGKMSLDEGSRGFYESLQRLPAKVYGDGHLK